MTIDKLPSGKYRIRQQVDGKRYSLVIDYKPSRREAQELINDLSTHIINRKKSFYAACENYTSMKENVLSPRTVKEYLAIPSRLPGWFTSLDVMVITQEDIQKCINEISIGRSPKTVASYHGFISAVLGMFRPSMVIHTTLPQRKRSEPYIPSEDNVKRILEYAKDSEYEIPLKLACMGLRRSEICCLQITDLDDKDVIHINKALVLNKDKQWVVKSTKTTMSERDVPIPHELAELIRRKGYIFKQYPNTISNYLRRVQDELGMEHFSIHKLRHFFASKLMDLNVSQKDIMSMGGWAYQGTLENIYQHSLKAKTEEGRKQISNAYTQTIFE